MKVTGKIVEPDSFRGEFHKPFRDEFIEHGYNHSFLVLEIVNS